MSSPASDGINTDSSSQLPTADGPSPKQEDVKMEVTKKEEKDEDEGAETQEEEEVHAEMGKGQLDVKTEEKPVVRILSLKSFKKSSS